MIEYLGNEIPPIDQKLLNFAVSITRKAGRLSHKWFKNKKFEVKYKSDGSPVTMADQAAEKLLRKLITDTYPEDSIIGEEEANVMGSSGRTWIIDPIDGTQSFIRGVPLYGNLLAFNDNYGPAIGVINLPELNECIWAGRGQGCFINGKPTQISNKAELSGACVVTSGVDYWPSTDVLNRLSKENTIIRTWGDAYGWALVATGRADAVIDPVVNEWDVAPMITIINESGGMFTDFTGKIQTNTGTALAANPKLHPILLKIIDQRL